MEINPFIIFVLSLMTGAICAKVAIKKGKNPKTWFIVGVLIGLLGLVILLFVSSKKTTKASLPKNTHPFFEKDTDKLWYYLDYGL